MREKLIELLFDVPEVTVYNRAAPKIADYLIANGVTVQQKGHWKYYSTGLSNYNQCSVCKGGIMRFINYPYCPWCGAKMEE
jgi:hypothetical protein